MLFAFVISMPLRKGSCPFGQRLSSNSKITILQMGWNRFDIRRNAKGWIGENLSVFESCNSLKMFFSQHPLIWIYFSFFLSPRGEKYFTSLTKECNVKTMLENRVQILSSKLISRRDKCPRILRFLTFSISQFFAAEFNKITSLKCQRGSKLF